MATLNELLKDGTTALTGSSGSPRLDAELLLGLVTGKSRAYLAGFGERSVSVEEEARYRALIARRKAHEPVAYLTGYKEFFGIDIQVSPAVLIPRPDTEVLVERAIEFLEGRKDIVRVLDLGTGSGCIPIALASFALKAGRRLQIVAVDKSHEALEIASHNSALHGLSEMITFKHSDWFSAFDGTSETFDLIVSNPPYIPLGSKERSPETDYEPASALFAGPDGLADISHIISAVPLYLAPKGAFLCEIGSEQAQSFIELWSSVHPELSCRFEVLRDLAGLERCVVVSRE
jgi:release factor glutamine methyltransferase